jgi:hypothetical protein
LHHVNMSRHVTCSVTNMLHRCQYATQQATGNTQHAIHTQNNSCGKKCNAQT